MHFESHASEKNNYAREKSVRGRHQTRKVAESHVASPSLLTHVHGGHASLELTLGGGTLLSGGAGGQNGAFAVDRYFPEHFFWETHAGTAAIRGTVCFDCPKSDRGKHEAYGQRIVRTPPAGDDRQVARVLPLRRLVF